MLKNVKKSLKSIAFFHIGYGHVFCYTNIGKIVTIAYAIIGIPILLAFLANIGQFLAHGIRMLFEHLVLMKGCRKAYRRRAESIAFASASAANSPKPVRSTISGGSGGGGGKASISTTGSSGANSPVTAHRLPPGVPAAAVSATTTRVSASPLPARPQQYRDFRPTIVVQDGEKAAPEVRSAAAGLSSEGYTPDQVEYLEDAVKAEKTVPVLMCVVIMGVYLFGGAVLFSVWEG